MRQIRSPGSLVFVALSLLCLYCFREVLADETERTYRTRTPYPTRTASATQTPTQTPRPSATATPRPSVTLTQTPVGTATPTQTPGATFTPVPTLTMPPTPGPTGGPSTLGQYVILGWNDLGMHCMNADFSNLCVLPPYNNIHAQVIRRGEEPRLVSSGVTINYRFPANTYSVGKSNFWTYAQSLFGVVLPDNIGLTGHGLTGQLTWNGSYWEVTGVPIVPFEDAAPLVEQPYQLMELTLMVSGTQADKTTIVAPTSVEMHCELCHSSPGPNVTENILRTHDINEQTNLINSRPVLCANCHSSNALGKPGQPGIPSLSLAMHQKHAETVPTVSCYSCHPGTKTQCHRDAMYIAGKRCADCHGTIAQVAQTIVGGRQPWIDEPKCATCHPAQPEAAGMLYRNSNNGHHGVYCTTCHNSPHAVLPTIEPRDGLQMMRVQGVAKTLKDCRVCHITYPNEPGPHGITASQAMIASEQSSKRFWGWASPKTPTTVQPVALKPPLLSEPIEEASSNKSE